MPRQCAIVTREYAANKYEKIYEYEYILYIRVHELLVAEVVAENLSPFTLRVPS